MEKTHTDLPFISSDKKKTGKDADDDDESSSSSEEENDRDSNIKLGRGVFRLVTLFDPLMEIIELNDEYIEDKYNVALTEADVLTEEEIVRRQEYISVSSIVTVLIFLYLQGYERTQFIHSVVEINSWFWASTGRAETKAVGEALQRGMLLPSHTDCNLFLCMLAYPAHDRSWLCALDRYLESDGGSWECGERHDGG